MENKKLTQWFRYQAAYDVYLVKYEEFKIRLALYLVKISREYIKNATLLKCLHKITYRIKQKLL